ncbi:MAG: pyruvate dehydrogenase complex dihydrolipoamide acetyltransferase [Paracoccaceae bacterium]|nr:pyruvate dehydrogenase complex dihydrolipoamide acetyltransferase [Paracoccaceae bacterium]
MAIQILMPALSPTMEEGTLAKWLVKEGDTVSSGDLLAEIETDKAVMDFEAVDDGVIGRLLVPEGAEGVKVNTPIAVLLEEGEDASAIDSATTAPAPEPAQEAPAAAAPPPAETKAPPAPPAPDSDGKRIFASPLARRLATDRGLDLATIKGTGPHGRIIKADVEAAVAAPKPAVGAALAATPAGPATAPAAGPNAEQIKALYADREFQEVTLDGMRRTIAARLSEAKQTIPHFYLRRDIRIDALLDLRARMNKGLAARGIKLSVNDYIIKASALALQDVPDCNAIWAGDRILKLKPSDVAVAVAIEGGLFTPVLRDADKKTLSTLSAEMKDLAARARARKLAPNEYQGGSFAISNLGMFGITNFDAVINPPHGSILAVGAGEKKPVVNDAGEIEVATVMSVTLSVDHRVIDGALGAQFLTALKGYLEDPLSMLA